MYTIWRTRHAINQRVVEEFRKGSLRLSRVEQPFSMKDADLYDPAKKPPPSLSYGILRGTETIFNACKAHGVEWWEMDRGYFKPDHFEGYYRISMNGTRARYDASIDVPADRWDALNINLAPWKKDNKGYILLCPPTDPVREFYGLPDSWEDDVRARLDKLTDRPIITRTKHDDSNIPVEYALDNAYAIITYNSNVAIDALIRGIPAFSLDGTQHTPELDMIESDQRFIDRERLFRYLAYCQFTLPEFAKGLGWLKAVELQKYGVIND